MAGREQFLVINKYLVRIIGDVEWDRVVVPDFEIEIDLDPLGRRLAEIAFSVRDLITKPDGNVAVK